MLNCGFKLAALIDSNDPNKEVYKVDLEWMKSLATLLSTEYSTCLITSSSGLNSGLNSGDYFGLANIPL